MAKRAETAKSAPDLENPATEGQDAENPNTEQTPANPEETLPALSGQSANASPVLYSEGAVGGDFVRAGSGDDALVLKVKKRVAMPVLSFSDNMTIVVQFRDAMHKGKEIVENSTSGKPKMAPAIVATIQSLSGEQRTLICGEVLQRELNSAYPKESYVGAWFHITKLPKKEGKNYATFVINEIEPPAQRSQVA